MPHRHHWHIPNPIDLGTIPPRPRLLYVIVVTSGLSLIFSLWPSVVALAGALLIFAGSGCLRKWPFILIVLSAGGLYFASNALLSPAMGAGPEVLVFRVNHVGIIMGCVGACKRSAMLCVSLAWLNRTSIPEIYQSLSVIKRTRKWLTIFLRQMQLVRGEILSLRQSVVMRDVPRSWWDVKVKTYRGYLVLQGVLLRSFETIGVTAFAAETHSNSCRSAAPSIVTQKLTVSYSAEDRPAINEVCVSIKGPGLVYLGGYSGSGRTTLLRALSGYVPRITGNRSGLVQVSGVDTSGLELREICGLVRMVASDVVSSIIGLTVGQEMMMCAESPEQALAHLQEMGVDHLWDRETSTLSGGEQFRLALACALATRVAVLLLDSPLSQLDPTGRVDFLEALDRFRREGKRLIVVADDRFDVFYSRITHLLWMDGGKLVASYGPAELTTPLLQEFRERLESHISCLRPASPRSAEPVAALEDITVKLGDTLILSDFSISIGRGECIAVLGRNGSGKTTVALALAGLVPLEAGVRRATGRVGIAFQNPRLQTVERTSRGELRVAPQLQHWSDLATERFLREGLEFCALQGDENPIDMHPQVLRFLSIAAIRSGLTVLILDEPSNCLDSAGLIKLGSSIETLLEEKIAIIIITHDRELIKYAQRAVTLESGRIVSDETIPRNPGWIDESMASRYSDGEQT